MDPISSGDKGVVALHYAQQAEKLSFHPPDQNGHANGATTAIQAKFITPHDPIIQLQNGDTLPGVPPAEAEKLNRLKDALESPTEVDASKFNSRASGSDRPNGEAASSHLDEDGSARTGTFPEPDTSVSLGDAVPPSRTNPLFPPLPLYGPPNFMLKLQCLTFRVSSFFLSLGFLGVIVLGSAFTSLPLMFRHIGLRLTFRDPDARRPFYEEEVRRKRERRAAEKAWRRHGKSKLVAALSEEDNEGEAGKNDGFEPSEGGKDPLVCDVGYYARRVGLDVEEFSVQTEDGFIIYLWHVFDPKEYTALPAEARRHRSNENFFSEQGGVHATFREESHPPDVRPKYPVLLMHGLLQSAGAYCCNDDDSLAFFLCKSGYDVWLGNNRCGFKPEHVLLKYPDPRMWAWNIRQMGVLDLPALISRVLHETQFEKLGLVCHSQGTTETFVALAKEQRPDLGNRISVFCALAPAAYAGPLIGKAYFKFMRVISPGLFRVIFGIHAFIPFMMAMHRILPGWLYGALGYRVFSFLFNWTDDRWEQDLRDRMFQFAPVYISSESMRWWLGRECFAKQKCILNTREENQLEDILDNELEDNEPVPTNGDANVAGKQGAEYLVNNPGALAWYDEQAPPFALWVAGSDDLVDGRKLLRRFERGREPHVRVVHSKLIEEYEHLDVIWAMDSIEKVGKEVREVIWKTLPKRYRTSCRTPKECENVKFLEDEE
ncbi:MAG: hypothetical protein M1825_006134 [Sarcosagium campestre]|nr:MAG: hypothetical protein M1825_006134 [Sarcosagium campestre]